MKRQKNKILVLTLTILMVLAFCGAAVAETVDIGAGLSTVSQDDLATKVKDIFMGIGYFVGVVAVGALIFNGFKLVTASNDQERAQAKTHVMWALGGVVLVGLALMVVGAVISIIGS